MGEEVEVELPGAGEPVPARVLRAAGDGVVALAFRQDSVALARIDSALALIGAGEPAAAAA